MKVVLLTVALLGVPVCSWADCQLISSQKKVSWGTLSAAERQLAKGQLFALAEKKLQVHVVCSEPRRIRLFINSDLPQNGSAFSFGDAGQMQVIASHSAIDNKPVRIAPVHFADTTPQSGGSEQLEILPHQGLAFVDSQEVYGKNASVTFSVIAKIKPGSVVDKTTWRGNLNIKMDVQ